MEDRYLITVPSNRVMDHSPNAYDGFKHDEPVFLSYYVLNRFFQNNR